MAKKKVTANPSRPAQSLKIAKDASGEWRWSVKARNGKIIATSGEGYVNRTDCMRGMLIVLKVLFQDMSDQIVLAADVVE